MPGPITITYTNFSGTTFKKSNSYSGYGVEKGVGSLSTQPLDTLQAYGGQTSIEMDENALSNIAGGYAWIDLGWKESSTDLHFGVKIYMPMQVLHMGDRPYYEVAHANSSGPNWVKAGDSASEPYTFPTSIGYKVLCIPKSEHTSLIVNVQIDDLN